MPSVRAFDRYRQYRPQPSSYASAGTWATCSVNDARGQTCVLTLRDPSLLDRVRQD